MTKKGARLRGIVRWGVWLCTFLAIVWFVVSIWVGVGFSVEHVPKNNIENRRFFSADSSRGVFGWVYYPKFTQVYFSSREPGWHTDGGFYLNSTYGNSEGAMSYFLPRISNGGGSGGPSRQFEIPLIYPTLLMVCWSGCLIRGVKRRRRLLGCCMECGYSLEGLGDGVCPECGAGSGG